MGFASKLLFPLGLAAAMVALPVQAGVSPLIDGWPTVAQAKRVISCSWGEDAKTMSCPARTCDVTLAMWKAARRDRIVRLEMMVAVRYDKRDQRAERRNIACAKTVLDLFLPAWTDRRAWFDAAVAKALKNSAISARCVSRKKITVEYEHPNLPAEYVNVVIE